jgi:nucleotide-binding universal stress UspA family protein
MNGEIPAIVVAFDGSESAGRALDRALAFATSADRVLVVTAIEVGGPGAQRVGEATPEARDEGEAILARARARAAGQGRSVETLLGEGPATDVVLDAVGQAGARLLVVGTRGVGAVERLLLGSVSSALVHHAPCDVLVVR